MTALSEALVTVREGGTVEVSPRNAADLPELVAEVVTALDGRNPGRIVRDRHGVRLVVSAATAKTLGVGKPAPTKRTTKPKTPPAEVTPDAAVNPETEE